MVAGAEQVDLLASGELDVPGVGRRLPPRLFDAASRVGTEPLLVSMLHTLLGAGLGAGVVLVRASRPLARSMWVVPALGAVPQLGRVVVATRHPSIATFVLQSGGGWFGAMAATAVVTRRRSGTVTQ